MPRTYTNPVYDRYFADPFVLEHDGVYFAYGTLAHRGRTFAGLRSNDLVSWESLGDVLEPLAPPRDHYWAPEVAVSEGGFFMYYSAGHDEGIEHKLRVALADDPAGPFRDSGIVLEPDEPFTIDAHPFRDDDGRWYLYYCVDFLEGERVGTGIVARELEAMTRLAGERRVVVRPFADWNLYEADRYWYSRVTDWYTVEGPFVRKRGDTYYCFFSGGSWRELNYGVGYAVAEHPLGPWEVPVPDRPAILGTTPEVLGPGHASIVESPSGREDFLVYHGWDTNRDARLMRLDRLEWTAEGPRCAGPSTEPRPVPS